MCIATAVSQTEKQGHCQSSAIARVEKTQFPGLVAHWLPHLHRSLKHHVPHDHADLGNQFTPCSTPRPLSSHSPRGIPSKPLLPGMDAAELTRDGCSNSKRHTSLQGRCNRLVSISMRAAPAKLLLPDRVMLVSAGATRQKSFPGGLQKLHNPLTSFGQDCFLETRGPRVLPERGPPYI